MRMCVRGVTKGGVPGERGDGKEGRSRGSMCDCVCVRVCATGGRSCEGRLLKGFIRVWDQEAISHLPIMRQSTVERENSLHEGKGPGPAGAGPGPLARANSL